MLGHKVMRDICRRKFSENSAAGGVCFLNVPNGASLRRLNANCGPQLGAFGFSAADIGKPPGVLSGGEKIRLAFLRLFLAPPNFMLLDEPTTHLDLEGRATLEKAIRLIDGTVCLVSHDIEFVRNTVTSIIEISPAGVRRFLGGYEYYREKTAGEYRDGSPHAAASASAMQAEGAVAPVTCQRVARAPALRRGPSCNRRSAH
jgi:ATP-binding cassette subfamily F protein 3